MSFVKTNTELVVTAGVDTYTATIPFAEDLTYIENLLIVLSFTTNTGAATLNINSLGALPIYKNVNVALAAGDLSGFNLLYFSGASFQIVGKVTAAGAGGGFSTLSADTTATFLSEENTIVTTVLSALITAANFKTFTAIPTATTATSLDDFTLNGVTFNIENIVDGVSFDLRASAINNATGVYSFKYIITYS